ncbi:MAG: hypothetical protein EA343_15680 [Nodularia sp. (in: Bacteria)]|nr:MAG: hypothetical protein EA343_15680 [Nodularia sp. (in: cyanobacteria)]
MKKKLKHKLKCAILDFPYSKAARANLFWIGFNQKLGISNPKLLTNYFFSKYTQQFVQPEHFSYLQLDTNTFNLQNYLLEADIAQPGQLTFCT